MENVLGASGEQKHELNSFLKKGLGWTAHWALTSSSSQVLSKGQPLGPAGVQVSLRSTGADSKIQSTVTQPGGK